MIILMPFIVFLLLIAGFVHIVSAEWPQMQPKLARLVAWLTLLA
jgi:hypothetical protein